MCLNAQIHQLSRRCGLSRANLKLNRKAQAGSSLVMALFIIVLMSILLLALGRQLISSSKSVSIEVQGNRAFNAAQSGLQLGLTQLFPIPLNSTASCVSVAASFSFNQPGLQNCQAVLRCFQVNNPDLPTRPLYRLTSTGSCQAGEIKSSRVVVMEAY